MNSPTIFQIAHFIVSLLLLIVEVLILVIDLVR